MMPPLLLAAPFYIWCNLCSLRWIQRNSTMPFGQVLAATVLIQKPISVFEVMALSLTWIVSVCVCFDVQFSIIHIIVLSCVFLLVQVPASVILKASTSKGPVITYDTRQGLSCVAHMQPKHVE